MLHSSMSSQNKLVAGKHVSEMTNEERREAECFFAEKAVQSAVSQWGVGWEHLNKETRKAHLMLAIVEYMSGQCWSEAGGIPRQSNVGWKAEDCWLVLEVCRGRSGGNDFGMNMVRSFGIKL